MADPVIILMGGNLGDTPAYFQAAERELSMKEIMVIKRSAVYRSKAWGFTAAQDFLNRAFEIKTDLTPQQLLEAILETEKKLGRKRKAGGSYESRTLDIDILCYGNDIVAQENLVIPHLRLHERKFALTPLREIAPGWVHPVLNKNCDQMLGSCSDAILPLKLADAI